MVTNDNIHQHTLVQCYFIIRHTVMETNVAGNTVFGYILTLRLTVYQTSKSIFLAFLPCFRTYNFYLPKHSWQILVTHNNTDFSQFI